MGQFLSATLISQIWGEETMICGTGANIIFLFPGMRQLMSWLGTRPVNRESFSQILSAGHHCAVIPGGIAEMYLASEKEEVVFIRRRRNTVKLAIQNGTHICPAYFFGNTSILHFVGSEGNDSFLSIISRKMKASVMFFYGRLGLPIPVRHPIRMVAFEVIKVTQCENPTDAQVDAIMAKLEESLISGYNSKKPAWESRPLRIT